MANIQTTVELNKLLQEQNKLFQTQAKIMKGQLAAAKAMAEAMGKVDPNKLSNSFREMDEAIKSADEALKEFSTSGQSGMDQLAKGTEETGKQFEKMGGHLEGIGKKGAIIGGIGTMFIGFNKTFTATMGLLGSAASIAGTLAKSLLNLGVSLVTLPFKIFNNLLSVAQEFTMTGFAQELQNVRKEFGDLATNEGKAVLEGYKNIRGEIENTGISAFRVLGNMKERLEFVRTTAMNLGRQFQGLKDDLSTNTEAIAAYIKGLGLSAESQKSVAKAANASGKSFSEVGREITTMAYGMGEAFGINGKLISKDMGQMVGDFKNFGSVSIKEMSQIAVFTQKLGLEIKDLLGLIGKFDDFESAAQSAAQLSQAFGIQIDTLGMLKEQDPAKRFEQLRKAFQATGKDIEKLNRQELQLLASQSGLSEETLRLGFSQSKAGMSYEEIQKQSDATSKKQLTQAEAMEKLANSIERMVKEGPKMKGGFFDIFLQGFERGFKWSKEWRGMMINLHRAMRITWQEGVRVGREFINSFPGVADMIGGLKELFAPDSWKKLMSGVGKVFTDFFQNLKSGGPINLEKFLKAFQDNFINWFDESKPEGKKILTGFKTFFETMIKIGTTMLKFGLEKLTEGVQSLTNFIRDPGNFLENTMKQGGGFLGTFAKLFDPLFQVIVDSWQPLFLAFVGLFEVVWEKLKKVLEPLPGKLLDAFLELDWKTQLMVLGPFLAPMFSTILVGGLAKGLGFFSEKGGQLLSKALKKLFLKVEDMPDVPKQAEQSFKAAAGLTDGAKKFFKSLGGVSWKTLGKNAAIGVLAIAGLVTVMAAQFMLISKAFEGAGVNNVEQVAKAMKLMGLLYLEAAAVILAGAGLSLLAPIAPLVLAGVAAIGLVASGMAVHAISIMSAIDSVKVGSGFDKKASVFLKIITVMTDLAKSMGDIMKLAMPSLKTFLIGNPEKEMRKTLGAVKSIIETMGSEIRSIISYINTTITGMGAGQMEAAGVMATALGATAQLAKALVPSPELIELAKTGLDEGIDALDGVSAYMARTSGIIQQLLPSMKTMVESIKGENINAEAVGVFSNFMGAVSSLVKALVPDPKMLEVTKEFEKTPSLFQRMGLVGGKVEKQQRGLVAPQSPFAKLIENFLGESGVMTKLKGFMVGLSEGTKGMDLSQMKASMDLFSQTISAMTNFSNFFSKENLENLERARGINFGPLLDEINTNTVIPFKEKIPQIFGKGFTSRMWKDVNAGNQTLDKVVGAVKDMILKFNETNKALHTLEPFNLKTTLEQTADKLGLKGADEISVKHGDINFMVNVEVKLSTEDIEDALLSKVDGAIAKVVSTP